MIEQNQIVLDLAMVSMITSVIASQVTQKIKDLFKVGKFFNKLISIIISLWIGFIYSISFFSDSLLYAFWVGIFTLIGSENFYKIINDKLNFKTLSNLKNKKE